MQMPCLRANVTGTGQEKTSVSVPASSLTSANRGQANALMLIISPRKIGVYLGLSLGTAYFLSAASVISRAN